MKKEKIQSGLDPSQPLGALHQRRVKNNQDLTVLVEDYHSRRGTGKTVASIKLADHFDTTDEGLTYDKCSLSPEEITTNYTEQPRGSALVLDEAESGLDKYRAGSSVNKAMRDVISMGRIMEKYLVVNAPAAQQLSTDIRRLFDVVIMVLRKGLLLVHFVKGQPYEGGIYLDDVQEIQVSDIRDPELREVYNQLADEKQKRLENNEDEYIQRSEVNEMLDNAQEEAGQNTRNDIIRQLLNETDLGPSDIAPGLDISPQRVGQIYRGN